MVQSYKKRFPEENLPQFVPETLRKVETDEKISVVLKRLKPAAPSPSQSITMLEKKGITIKNKDNNKLTKNWWNDNPPKWVNEDNINACQICTGAFTGGWFSSGKHHCRNCGKVICDKCTVKCKFKKRGLCNITTTKACRKCAVNFRKSGQRRLIER